jgi:propionyl-CoA synthetase
MTQSYQTLYQQWQEDPQRFWAEAAEAVDWYKKWDTILDESEAPIYRWYSGAEVNSCYNALDRHVGNGRSHQPALIYDSPVTGTVQTITYAELLDQVSRFAGVLRKTAWSKATASSSTCRWCPRRCSPCWPAPASARSTPWCSAASPPASCPPASMTPNPSWCLTASCGIEPGRVVATTSRCSMKPSRGASPQTYHIAWFCSVRSTPRTLLAGRDVDWRDAPSPRAEPADCVESPPPIRSTSSTPPAPPAQPKGVVRDTGGYLVALRWSMKHIYGVQPGRGLLGGLRRGLGGGAFLHRLWAAVCRLHHRDVRGQAGRHAGLPAHSGG